MAVLEEEIEDNKRTQTASDGKKQHLHMRPLCALKAMEKVAKKCLSKNQPEALLEYAAATLLEELGYQEVLFRFTDKDRSSREIVAKSEQALPGGMAEIFHPISLEGKSMLLMRIKIREPETLDSLEKTILDAIGNQLAVALKNYLLFDAVSSTKEYLEAVLQGSCDAICTTDMQGRIVYFSPGAEKIFGYAAQEVLGQPVANYFEKGREEAERIMDLLLKQDTLRDHPTVFIGRDGSRIFCSMSASLIRDKKGRVLGTLGVSKDVTQKILLEERLKKLSITDGLTGLYNQRYFYEVLDKEMKRARRQNSDLSLMLLDMDHFKSLNDQQGHLAGDRVLREISRVLSESIRQDLDIAFRYGGDEFAVLLPGLDAEGSRAVAERIQKAGRREELPVTFSIGIANCHPDHSVRQLIHVADRALYESKRARRGSIHCI
ncbi:MAG: GGDEF domain-containing protein [Elusimicrobia bacterium]|nr:GGDEF domain-containing protein [Elusimicrobiota bacterium]